MKYFYSYLKQWCVKLLFRFCGKPNSFFLISDVSVWYRRLLKMVSGCGCSGESKETTSQSWYSSCTLVHRLCFFLLKISQKLKYDLHAGQVTSTLDVNLCLQDLSTSCSAFEKLWFLLVGLAGVLSMLSVIDMIQSVAQWCWLRSSHLPNECQIPDSWQHKRSSSTNRHWNATLLRKSMLLVTHLLKLVTLLDSTQESFPCNDVKFNVAHTPSASKP